MTEKIKDKMAAHIETILNKATITNEEYKILSEYLSKLEYEKAKEERAANSAERDKRFHDLIDTMWGDVMSGM